jgi:hypothetical protein
MTNTPDKDDVMSKLKTAEIASVERKETKGFALEDDNGALVKVFVPTEQAADFERALATTLDDHLEDETEIAEILHELRKDFDIVNVEWSEDAIPEDEEPGVDGEVVDSDVEGPDGAMATGGEDAGGLGGDGAGADEEKDPMQASDTDIPGPGGVDSGSDSQAMSALDKIIDMMKGDAEARKAEADARKAEAAVSAGQVAAQAAAGRAKAEEEIMDMENYNKRQKEDKRERDLRSKLLKYRHDQQSDTQGEVGGGQDMGNTDTFESFLLSEKEYDDATPEEEEVMDMEDEQADCAEASAAEAKRKQVIRHRHDKKKGRAKKATVKEGGMFEPRFPQADEEEQELLDMEDHQEEEQERKKREATREKLLKFRHKKKKGKLTFADFQQSEKQDQSEPADGTDIKAQIDLSHRVQH